VDLRSTPATDYVCDITRLHLPAECVREIVTFHMVEHLRPSTLARLFAVWCRALQPGGRLVIECPDFDRVVREYLHGNVARLLNVFGRERFPGDLHRWGWNYERMQKCLLEAGFGRVFRAPATDYHVSEEPCMRVEAYKEQTCGQR